jgi:hypothetical protein
MVGRFPFGIVIIPDGKVPTNSKEYEFLDD